MTDSPLKTEEEYFGWVKQQANIAGLSVQSVSDLTDGCVILSLVSAWRQGNVPSFHQRGQRGFFSEFHAKENRKILCDILVSESKREKVKLTFSSEEIFTRGFVDTLRMLHTIYQNRDKGCEKATPNISTIPGLPLIAELKPMLASQRDSTPQDTVEVSSSSTSNPKHASQFSVALTNATFSDGNPRWTAVQEGGVLRIFMSSTFRDMQRERDEFFMSAEMRLKDHAAKKGLVLVFVDLRWGLTSETSGNGQVVISCLEAIDQCPYFLCTLGSRYGWSPNHENPSEWHPDTDLKFPYLTNIRGLSVTDYEIIHGVLNDQPVARRAFFYSRDEEYAVSHVAENEAERALYRPVDEKDKQNQDKLKMKISQRFTVKAYRNPKELIEMVIVELTDAIDADFPTNKTTDPEDHAHLQFMKHRLAMLEGRDSILQTLKERTLLQLDQDESHITVVGAESGIGKSTVMSGLVRDLEAASGNDTILIYHFVGCSNLSNYIENLVQRVVRTLCENEMLPFKNSSEEAKETTKKGLHYVLKLAEKIKKKRLILIIDAINQLMGSDSDEDACNLEWLPKRTSKNISIVVSTIESDKSCKNLESIGIEIVRLSKLDEEGIRQGTISFFKLYNKSLNEHQIQMILDDHQDTGHPLYLRIILDELRVFGVYEKLDEELYNLLETDGPVFLFDYVVMRWEEKYGTRLVRLSLGVLFLSRIGLNENEIESYMEDRMKKENMTFEYTTWKTFILVLLGSLFTRNGRYVYSHQLLKESINNRYFEDASNLQAELGEYGLWLLKKYGVPEDSPNIVAEICYSLLKAEKYQTLSEYLGNETVIELMLSGIYRSEFFQCWRVLNKNGFSDKETYQEISKAKSRAGMLLVNYFQAVHENDFLIPILEYRIANCTKGESNYDNFNYLGLIYQSMARYEDSLALFQKNIELEILASKEMNADIALLYNNAGNVLNILGRNDEALDLYQKSIDVQSQVLGEDHAELAITFNNVGVVFKSLGRYEEALDYYQRSLVILMKNFGEEYPDVASAYNNIGGIYGHLENYEKALEYFKKDIEITVKVFGEMHPNVATSYSNLGIALGKMGEYDEAIAYYEKSIDIAVNIFGEVHPSVSDVYDNMGSVYIATEMYEEALNFFNKALEINLQIFGEEHPSVALCYNNIGVVYNETNEYDEALKYFQRALETRLKVLGESHPLTAEVYKNIAYLHKSTEKFEDALENFKLSLDVQERCVEEISPKIAECCGNIGELSAMLGRYEDAIDMYSRARDIFGELYGHEHQLTKKTNRLIESIRNGNYDENGEDDGDELNDGEEDEEGDEGDEDEANEDEQEGGENDDEENETDG